MPLLHSSSASALSKNIGAEVRAGRPQAQAIGYSEQRAAKKKKKMTLNDAKKARRGSDHGGY